MIEPAGIQEKWLTGLPSLAFADGSEADRPQDIELERSSAVRPDGALYVSELSGVPFVTGFARIHRIAADGTTSRLRDRSYDGRRSRVWE